MNKRRVGLVPPSSRHALETIRCYHQVPSAIGYATWERYYTTITSTAVPPG